MRSARFGDMVAGQGQQGEAAAQGLAEGDVAGHGLIGQAGDLGADVVGVGRAGQGDVGQGLQRLDADEGRIEVEDEGRRVSHGASLADLRSCSNGRRSGSKNAV